MKKFIPGIVAIAFLTGCGTANGSEGEPPQQEESTGSGTINEEAVQLGSDEAIQEEASELDSSVEEFDLDIDFYEGREWEYEYERDGNEAEIERDEKIKGPEAIEEIETLLANIEITTDRPLHEMKSEVLHALNLEEQDVKEFELKIEYDGGEKIKFDHKEARAEENKAVREFDLDLEFVNGDEWEYEFERDDQETEIERDGVEIEGQEALAEIENLLEMITITMDRPLVEMKEEVLNALDIQVDEVEEFDLEIDYEDGEEISLKHDLS